MVRDLGVRGAAQPEALQQMRLVLDSDAALEEAKQLVAPHLDAVTNRWAVEPLFANDGAPYLIIAEVGEVIGTREYARRAHTLVQELFDVSGLHQVEADLPVNAYENPEAAPAFAGEMDLEGTEQLRWARDAIQCEKAWQLTPEPGGRSRGEGILIGHPDSGYTDHWGLGLEALALDGSWDVISDDDDASDPLVPPEQSPWPIPNPGHGTATASVIVGRGGEAQGVVGVAPRAKLVPIRATESVVQLFDSDVARAVDRARKAGCHIVSMSLGGKGFFGLRRAIQRAVDSGMIVAAAAGNKVGFVVAPASYDNCLAVAATGFDDSLWEGSSRGPAVDVAAPGRSVHVAAFEWSQNPPGRLVRRSSGTSYAVTHLAGVAALWLAHHGLDRLRAAYGEAAIQAAFVHVLRQSRRRPPIWDSDNWGVGIIDAAALLATPLPSRDSLLPMVGAFSAADGDPVDRLSALLAGVDPGELRDALSIRLGFSGSALNKALRRFEGELAYLLLEEGDFRDSLLAAARPGAFPPGPVNVPSSASPQLESLLA